MAPMDVELLYFDGCPGFEPLLARVRALLQQIDPDQQVRLVRVADVEHAVAVGFLGSPSLRVDGHDVEPGADARKDFGMTCRLYDTPSGRMGMPPDAWIRRAIAIGAPEA